VGVRRCRTPSNFVRRANGYGTPCARPTRGSALQQWTAKRSVRRTAGNGQLSIRYAVSTLAVLSRPQLTNRDFPHFEFLDLAGDGHRKRIHESDIAGYFEVRDPAPTEVLDILVRELCSLLQFHPGHHFFAILVVRDADYLHIADTRTVIEKLLDLTRIDILSTADNHVFNTTGDAAVAVFVHNSEVSAVQPAIQVEDAAGGFQVLVVALHHHVAARAQLSRHTDRNRTSGLYVGN